MKPVRILLVDDEPATGTALEGWLRQCGFEVVYADGPTRADAALATTSFDVVLSDIQMPGNFKLEWIARRLHEECPPPILLMTGDPQLETAMRAANLPVAGYLLKPLFYEDTAARLESLAADHRRRRELLELSREVTHLVSAAPVDLRAVPLAQELHRLARELATEARRSPREAIPTDQTAPWRDAVAETITVLEKTKHSFRSKELGELRRRLQRLVPARAGEAAFSSAPPPAAKKIIHDFPTVGA